MSRHVSAVLIGLALTGLPVAEIRAQGVDNPDSVRASVTTAGQKPVQIAVVNNLDQACATGPQPELKVPGLPRHGKILARSVDIATGRNNRCPDKKVTGQIVVYQANPNYAGPDEVTIAVHPHAGAVRTTTIRIIVTGDALPAGQQRL